MMKVFIIHSIIAGLPGVLVKANAINSSTLDANVGDDDTESKRPGFIDDKDNIDGFYRASGPISNERDLSSPSASSSSNTVTDDYFDTFDVHQHDINHGQSAYYYNNNQNMILNKKKHDDDLTYLDLFGERAKELLTQHLVPSTDAECHWDWRTGRCEPYCACAIRFLWGDFHLGRSCRFRHSPPPTHFFKETPQDEIHEEASWQEAWQEVWQTKLTDGTVDTSFLPPLFSADQSGSSDTTSSTPKETSATCTLPPESRYIQIVNHFANILVRSTRVVERFHNIQKASSTTFNNGIVHGRHHWMTMRRKSCEIVKSKVEERAKGRNQPVVLTRQGATWIRRVCGPTGNDIARRMGEVDHVETFEDIPR